MAMAGFTVKDVVRRSLVLHAAVLGFFARRGSLTKDREEGPVIAGGCVAML